MWAYLLCLFTSSDRKGVIQISGKRVRSYGDQISSSLQLMNYKTKLIFLQKNWMPYIYFQYSSRIKLWIRNSSCLNYWLLLFQNSSASIGLKCQELHKIAALHRAIVNMYMSNLNTSLGIWSYPSVDISLYQDFTLLYCSVHQDFIVFCWKKGCRCSRKHKKAYV